MEISSNMPRQARLDALGTLPQRVLESSKYLETLYSEAGRKQKETLRLLAQKVDLTILSGGPVYGNKHLGC
jgi:hypothetical protein